MPRLKKGSKPDLAVIFLVFVFLFSASMLLSVNSFLPREAGIPLRTSLAFVAQAAIAINSLVIIKEKLARAAILVWFLGIIIWRSSNYFGLVQRPIFAETFFILFSFLILVGLVREVLKYKVNRLVLAFLVLVVLPLAYFDFLYGKEVKITALYTFFDALLIGFSLALFTKVSQVKHIGYFLIGVADFCLLWQLRGWAYYIASWVEIIFVMALFIFTLGFRKEAVEIKSKAME